MEMKKIDLNSNAFDSVKEEPKSPSQPKKFPFQWLAFGLALILGLPTGFFLAKKHLPSQTTSSTKIEVQNPTDKSQIKVGQVFGSSDEKTFRDHAVGVLKKGGIDGEGSHHLVRPGGPSKNVYLTSSVVDLDLFDGAKVEVWGETFGAKKAGWLMDVGRIKVLDLHPAEPQE